MVREAMTMSIQTQELHPGFAAEAGFLDLSRPLDGETSAAIQAAIDAYPVLIFRDQRLTDAQLRDFAAHFGPLEIGRSAARPGRRRLAIPQIGDISNLDVDNKVRTLDDRRRLDGLGNRLWHTDASYMPVPVVLGMLHAVVLPPQSPFGNGETEFADMRAAYDALPAATKDAVDPLTAEHDVFGSVFIGTCVAHLGLAGRRRAPAAVRSERARNAKSFCLQPYMAGRRPGDLGQPLDDASRPSAR
jgi:alpha-ketoglutarate-dependent 2,4-dichlorophenoxyacetate dioxygenase